MTGHSTPPLQGLRVLDLTQFLSGPYCTQVLGDLGAEIVKLEAPQGDLARHIPPHFVGDDSIYFLAVNRNKKSIAIDMKTQEGRDLDRRLALGVDIVVENYRPGVVSRLGLDAAELRREKPELIWCSISGFGQDGPYRDMPAYDMVVQALSGGMSLTGEPGGPAVRAGIPIGDICAGLYAVVGVLAALHRRRETGRGETVDVSMLDCQAAMLSYQAAYHLHSGAVPGRQGARHDSIPTYRSFRAGDGVELVVTANTERMWKGLCAVLGLEHLTDDARFRTNRERQVNREALWPLLEEAFLAAPAQTWVERLREAEVPVGAINTLDAVAEDPQIRHRGMVVDLDRGAERVRVMGDPLVFEETKRDTPSFPPRLGENAGEVLSTLLSLDAAEIERLRAAGILAGV